ncbi:hypothetical protein CUC15_09715 [Oceanobacillus zhaokaii]|uniref:Uncharacterized protein n=1 Tax=Oceanobacillus zhaokaii TaxID=2052660 RepID=A0A345PGQ7_9BACI|nr:hypothetical protein [Oceanobacillus zhaokaii]AXI09187.1 hypothetical protein CUC15_09715 [Oceanobacillus zhaokaii]
MKNSSDPIKIYLNESERSDVDKIINLLEGLEHIITGNIKRLKPTDDELAFYALIDADQNQFFLKYNKSIQDQYEKIISLLSNHLKP